MLHLLHPYSRRDRNQETRRGSCQGCSSARGNSCIAIHPASADVLSSTPEVNPKKLSNCERQIGRIFDPLHCTLGIPFLSPFLFYSPLHFAFSTARRVPPPCVPLYHDLLLVDEISCDLFAFIFFLLLAFHPGVGGLSWVFFPEFMY